MGIFAAREKHNSQSVLTRNARLPKDNWSKQMGPPCCQQSPQRPPRRAWSSDKCWSMLLRTRWGAVVAQVGETSLQGFPEAPVLLANLTFYNIETGDWPQGFSSPLMVFSGPRSGSLFQGWSCSPWIAPTVVAPALQAGVLPWEPILWLALSQDLSPKHAKQPTD